MDQSPLPGFEAALSQIVNVASVPQRSPFRYPGGKTWLVPHVRRWLHSLPFKPAEFVEPFAGGAIVGLTVAFEGLADHVTLVELDEQVASVWETIVNDGDAQWLTDQIVKFELRPRNVDDLLSHAASTRREQAFQTIIKNRVNRGGILAVGAGKLKNGEKGKGIGSRWYPATLCKRILAIHTIRERIRFIKGDGLEIIADLLMNPNTAFFIDPPYTASGKKPGQRLYTHSAIDHSRLFKQMNRARGNWLMTYDDQPEIRMMAAHYGFDVRAVAMKNTHHARKMELLIGRNMRWLDL